MLPDIPAFRDSLAALSIEEAERTSLDVGTLLICDQTGRQNADGSLMTDRSVVVLRQSEKVPLSLDALVERLADELHHAGHAHVAPRTPLRLSLASKLLAAATLLRRSGDEALSTLNQVLKAVGEARVTQWAVLLSPAQEFSRHKFGEFDFGILDLHLLRQRSDRAGSDFADLYSERLRGRLALCRDARSIQAANVKPLARSVGSEKAISILDRVLNDYFTAISEAERRHLLLDLDRQQAIYGALGLGTISSEFFQRSAMYTFWITVFNTHQRGHGWVSSQQAHPTIATTDPSALSSLYDQIQSGLQLSNWGSKGLDAIIQTYAEYLYAARNYEEDGRIEEALLHSIFALDLLLGGSAKDPLTSLLADRVAVLTHLVLRQDFDEVVRFVRNAYDMRSAYVHRGKLGNLSTAC